MNTALKVVCNIFNIICCKKKRADDNIDVKIDIRDTNVNKAETSVNDTDILKYIIVPVCSCHHVFVQEQNSKNLKSVLTSSQNLNNSEIPFSIKPYNYIHVSEMDSEMDSKIIFKTESTNLPRLRRMFNSTKNSHETKCSFDNDTSTVYIPLTSDNGKKPSFTKSRFRVFKQLFTK